MSLKNFISRRPLKNELKRVNEEEDIEGAFLCSANFVGGQVDFRFVRPFVRPSVRSSVTLQVYPCVDAIIL